MSLLTKTKHQFKKSFKSLSYLQMKVDVSALISHPNSFSDGFIIWTSSAASCETGSCRRFKSCSSSWRPSDITHVNRDVITQNSVFCELQISSNKSNDLKKCGNKVSPAGGAAEQTGLVYLLSSASLFIPPRRSTAPWRGEGPSWILWVRRSPPECLDPVRTVAPKSSQNLKLASESSSLVPYLVLKIKPENLSPTAPVVLLHAGVRGRNRRCFTRRSQTCLTR